MALRHKSYGGFKRAAEQGLKERRNIPAILDVCREYNIPFTWATIGHLFLESCTRNNGIAHAGIKRLGYFSNKYWKFDNGDWFDADPCTNYSINPEWYCPDLIKMIVENEVNHEIGCHTFSHIDCRDEICPTEVFDSEILECKKHAAGLGIELKSFVHPAHTIGNLDGLIKNGFSSYRTDYKNTLGYPVKYKGKLWQLKSTWEFILFKEWSRRYHINRYCEILRRAMKSRTVCVLSFHPSMDIEFFETIFPEICKYVNERRDKIWVTTAINYVNFLDGKRALKKLMDDQYMKILIIANIRKKQGGITTQTLELADSLKGEGYEVVTVFTHGNMTERIRGFFSSLKEARKSDLIIGVGCAYYGVIPMLTASAASLISGKRILYNFHDGQAREFLKKYHGLLRLFFGKARIIVATGFLEKLF